MLFRNDGGASLDSHAHETITRLLASPLGARLMRLNRPPAPAPAAATGLRLVREGRERACKGGYKSCFSWFSSVRGNVLLWDEGGGWGGTGREKEWPEVFTAQLPRRWRWRYLHFVFTYVRCRWRSSSTIPPALVAPAPAPAPAPYRCCAPSATSSRS
jgi:hypothetical protein